MTTQNRPEANHPLAQIESLLIDASNTLYDMDDARQLAVYTTLDTAIDEALRIVQAWREDDGTPVGEREL